MACFDHFTSMMVIMMIGKTRTCRSSHSCTTAIRLRGMPGSWIVTPPPPRDDTRAYDRCKIDGRTQVIFSAKVIRCLLGFKVWSFGAWEVGIPRESMIGGRFRKDIIVADSHGCAMGRSTKWCLPEELTSKNLASALHLERPFLIPLHLV